MSKTFDRKLLRIGSQYKSSAVSIPKEIIDKALSEEVTHVVVSIKINMDSPDIVSISANYTYNKEN